MVTAQWMEEESLLCPDFSVHGGSMGEMYAKKISKVVEMAQSSKVLCWNLGWWRSACPRWCCFTWWTGELLDRLVQCSKNSNDFTRAWTGSRCICPGEFSDFTILGNDHGQLFMSSPLKHLNASMEKSTLLD